jgi:hypothetical protein
MRALAFVIAATAGRGGARAEDPCANSTTCSDCDAKISLGCSWCQPNAVIYQNGTKGHRCAWTNDPNKWFCLGKRPVAGCEVGYVCSGAPDFQCKLSGVPGEGEPDKHACMDACRPSPKWKVGCDRSGTRTRYYQHSYTPPHINMLFARAVRSRRMRHLQFDRQPVRVPQPRHLRRVLHRTGSRVVEMPAR